MDSFGLSSAIRRGLSTSAAPEHRYPYDKPIESTVNRGGATSTSTQLPKPAKHHRFQPTDIEETIHTLITHLRQNRHMKQIWEVAVKRNGMTTSLALLGSVLVADTLLYPGSKQKASRKTQHAVLQANLAPPGTSTAAAAPGSSGNNNSSGNNSGSISGSNSGSSSGIRHRNGVPGGTPAHA
jgi:hypothetical protein